MVTVPTLAIAAHGAASGAVPGLDGIALCLLIGVLAAICTSRRCGAIALLAVLSGAQFLSHLALSATMPSVGVSAAPVSSPGIDHHAGMDHHAAMSHSGTMSMPTASPLRLLSDHLVEMAHIGSADGMTMLLTHLIAVPVCAALIAAAVAVYSVITSVLAAICRTPTPAHPAPAGPVIVRAVVRWNRIDRAAGAGERGPPLLIA